MSAYVVERENVVRVVKLYRKIKGDSNLKAPPIKHHYSDVNPIRVEELAQELYKMNVKAVEGRYPDQKDSVYVETFDDYKEFNLKGDENLYQAYESAKCLCYQCAEDSTYESDLYNWLDKLVSETACYIVEQQEEYRSVEWK